MVWLLFIRHAVKRRGAYVLLVIGLCIASPRPAEANLISGLTKIVAGVFQLPVSILAGTFTGPPVIGTLMGAVNGTFRTVSFIAGGATELALDGVSLAKAAAPYVLPFLL